MDKNELNYDILIYAINIISYDGKDTQSIISQVSSIDIYESIFNPIVSCEVKMMDQLNLIENFPLIRQKVFLELEYKTSKLEGMVKRRFIVNEVGLITYDSQVKASTYTLQCLSEEIIEHTNKVVTDAIKGDIAEAVTRIVKSELKSKKRISVDKTKGIQSIQILNLKPLKAIDLLRKKAISQYYRSNTYLFFENINGFNFVTLEWLINNLKGPADATFFMKLGDDPSVARFRNILGYQGIVQDNATDLLVSGGLNHIHKRLDIATGVVSTFEIKQPMIESFLRGAGVNISPHLSTFITDNSKQPANTVFTVWDSTQGETFSYEQPLKDFYINLCTKHITRIFVYGDAALTCGDTVDIQLPIASSLAEDMNKVNHSKYMSGKFLISKVRHMISVKGGSTFEYRMALELIRPAYGETIQ